MLAVERGRAGSVAELPASNAECGLCWGGGRRGGSGAGVNSFGSDSENGVFSCGESGTNTS